MSYLLLVSLVYLLLGFGFRFGAWVVLVCGVSLMLSEIGSVLNFYVLMSEWVGMDSMSFIMVVLSVLVFMISLVSSYKDVKINKGEKEVNGISAVEAINIIVFGSIMFFSVISWMDFYFFFEFSLIPTFFLILKWGYQPERLQAGVLMLLYTVSASVPLMIGLLSLWWDLGSDNMLLVKMNGSCLFHYSDWVWIVLFLGFLVKLPIYGVHGWLPKAHVEAPLSGSMLLAGVLLKFGGYGLIRFIWFFKWSMSELILFLLALTLWGGVLSSCICVCQSDLKSLIAYSSIGHMAMSLGGLLSFYPLGKMACVCLLFAHGLCSPILFSLSASTYDFVGSRNVILSKGMLRSFPIFSAYWFIFCVVNMGFPPSLNFISEVFCVGSMLWLSVIFCVLGGIMCFMAGCYCLVLYSLVNHGGVSNMINSNFGMSGRYLSSCIFISIILLVGFLFMDYFFV
ncbi:NADH dehydrogenase subunit 4 (mitochondrion) [Mercenaria mercenaria]|uniref:NADH-ubiquinone oxidoreductase chain 4 n=1 Tax=Mercenaria mercenaria TaxID=6596 RepID=A0A6H0JT16_MERMC|nr:NADH dehydrogenase subunit 4 [Mercenaria mercenaria]QIU83222.1 NADH dehydrogenase subunit 4 [Mercenaria mercenaria]